jgi:hypothetical protein
MRVLIVEDDETIDPDGQRGRTANAMPMSRPPARLAAWMRRAR